MEVEARSRAERKRKALCMWRRIHSEAISNQIQGCDAMDANNKEEAFHATNI